MEAIGLLLYYTDKDINIPVNIWDVQYVRNIPYQHFIDKIERYKPIMIPSNVKYLETFYKGFNNKKKGILSDVYAYVKNVNTIPDIGFYINNEHVDKFYSRFMYNVLFSNTISKIIKRSDVRKKASDTLYKLLGTNIFQVDVNSINKYKELIYKYKNAEDNNISPYLIPYYTHVLNGYIISNQIEHKLNISNSFLLSYHNNYFYENYHVWYYIKYKKKNILLGLYGITYDMINTSINNITDYIKDNIFLLIDGLLKKDTLYKMNLNLLPNYNYSIIKEDIYTYSQDKFNLLDINIGKYKTFIHNKQIGYVNRIWVLYDSKTKEQICKFILDINNSYINKESIYDIDKGLYSSILYDKKKNRIKIKGDNQQYSYIEGEVIYINEKIFNNSEPIIISFVTTEDIVDQSLISLNNNEKIFRCKEYIPYDITDVWTIENQDDYYRFVYKHNYKFAQTSEIITSQIIDNE